MLEKVKLALRVTTDAFDAEILDLIAAGIEDLRLAGVADEPLEAPEAYPLISRAVVTYCRFHFGEPSDADKLKKSYDEQKAQLTTATGYTYW